jgi:hypothetical protein
MSTTQNEPDELLTEVAAAKQLTLSIRTLQAWRCRGEGPPFVRVGRAIRYELTAIRDWLKSNTVAPSSIRNPQNGRAQAR